jgi:magnesium transporter
MSPIDILKHKDDNSDKDTSGWATFIGIVICLCGNVIISFALNLQRLAHERIQRKLAARNSRPRSNRQPSENENGRVQDYGSNRSNHSKNDDDPEAEVEGTRYLKSSLWWTGLVLMVIGETGNFVACILSFFRS